MNSIDKSCNELKQQYDSCFFAWFKDGFLKGRTGMEACREAKTKYDACFNAWFSEHFLKGNVDNNMCEPLLKVYKHCVEKAMKEQRIDLKEIERDVLGTENENKVPPKAS